jgi:predicted transcriptional regulator
MSPVLAHFIDEADLSNDDIRKLQQVLDEKRKQQSVATGKTRRGRSK